MSKFRTNGKLINQRKTSQLKLLLGSMLQTVYDPTDRKRSPRPIDVFSLGRLTLFGVVRLRARRYCGLSLED